MPGHWRAFVATTHTPHEPVEARLGEIQVPVLVIMGDSYPDFGDPEAEADIIAERLSAELTVIPGAGHYPQAEYPEMVNPVVAQLVWQAFRLVEDQ